MQEYRKWGKIKSTYIDGYLKYLNPVTGCIHPELFALQFLRQPFQTALVQLAELVYTFKAHL